jgi:multidrug efflux system membrane fusion protein
MTSEQYPIPQVSAGKTTTSKTNLWKWGLVLLLTVAIVWLIYGRLHQGVEKSATVKFGAEKSGKAKFDPNSKPTPVLVAKPTQRDVNVYLYALGTVSPRNTVTVKTRVDGQLLSVSFSEGQMIKTGELLAQIDPKPFEVELSQMDGQLSKDKALLENALLDLDRYKTLIGQSSISKQTLDTQDSLVRQYRGAVAVDQSQVDNAKLQLSYCHITAPISGRVGLRQVDPGNIIHSADTTGIVTITQLQPITALFSVPEDNLPAVAQRMKSATNVAVDAFDRGQKVKLASGVLLSTDNQIDTTTGSIKMRAIFKNDDAMLFPNQFVNIKLLVGVQKNAIVIPLPALQHGKNGDYVYVVNQGNSVMLRPVKSGNADGESIAITQGLSLEDVVVTDGIDKLRDGAKIKITTADAALKNTSSKAKYDPTKTRAGWHKKQNAE